MPANPKIAYTPVPFDRDTAIELLRAEPRASVIVRLQYATRDWYSAPVYLDEHGELTRSHPTDALGPRIAVPADATYAQRDPADVAAESAQNDEGHEYDARRESEGRARQHAELDREHAGGDQ
jgi:hypothetical protein